METATKNTNKVLATEIKVGQIIKHGNQWARVISAPVASPYKKGEVAIGVVTMPSVVKYRGPFAHTHKDPGGVKTTYYYKATTLVTKR
jgi:hypothetical protein